MLPLPLARGQLLVFPVLLRSDFRKRPTHTTVTCSLRPAYIQAWSSTKKEMNYHDVLTIRNQTQEFTKPVKDLPASLLSVYLNLNVFSPEHNAYFSSFNHNSTSQLLVTVYLDCRHLE